MALFDDIEMLELFLFQEDAEMYPAQAAAFAKLNALMQKYIRDAFSAAVDSREEFYGTEVSAKKLVVDMLKDLDVRTKKGNSVAHEHVDDAYLTWTVATVN